MQFGNVCVIQSNPTQGIYYSFFTFLNECLEACMPVKRHMIRQVNHVWNVQCSFRSRKYFLLCCMARQ